MINGKESELRLGAESERKSPEWAQSLDNNGLQRPTAVVKNFKRFLGFWANTTSYK